ncbi:hypothetical protein M422DRAFT_53546 [Sphaerobolus stellatus SS14]|uniref:Uncharacterized protein n=1 Tax=Sphaerobolus stellatus (strain SS14) TaxID=990650 RepID=A0A0C9U958_SPHS4|nr:hypothetical protein M422DRAFT_53546 [Sphaerobolus stellatus SS14]
MCRGSARSESSLTPPPINVAEAASRSIGTPEDGSQGQMRPHAWTAGAAIDSDNRYQSSVAGSESEIDGPKSTSSDSTRRRNCISYVDNEGFSHIRTTSRNSITHKESDIERNAVDSRNRFSVLSNETPEIDRAFANMMRGIMNGLDDDTKLRLENRARALAGMEISQSTTMSHSNNNNKSKSRTSHRPSTKQDSSASMIRSWRSSLIPDSSESDTTGHGKTPSQAGH